MKYPEILHSDVLGEMQLDGFVDYATTREIDGVQNVNVVFVPGFLIPPHLQTEEEFQQRLRIAEQMFDELIEKKPSSLLPPQHAKLKSLALEYGFDEANELESELYRNWRLQDLILYHTGIRLIFFGNTIFPSLDLCLDYDRQWKLEELYFDG
ncbi:hypothetical protein V6x_63650 [Gimesia chilikensis]|uniref:Uncharacterized protein n=1 Tax=Gimesia chilikensis TaxID=2605989 RepID=A0A517WMW8_9PLAN|nr:hypothetical protein [Gimesia chilikensis]QDU06611.1 hypothetical protein V6x_63650 [Gimesia chilikensis]